MAMRDLREAVLEIAEEMLGEAEDLKNHPLGAGEEVLSHYLHRTLSTYARQLKIACKAAGEDTPTNNHIMNDPSLRSLLISPEVQHRAEIDKYRSEFSKQKIETEERFDGDMIEVVGGPACPDGAPTFQSADPLMPVGAYMQLAGGVYQLRKGLDSKKRLEYDDVQTQHMLRQMGGVS